jgi:hypothetical protein
MGISQKDLINRKTFQGTTSSIADGVTENLNISGFSSYYLYAIQVSHASWVRIYANSASRTADASRDEFTDPLPGDGVISEVITTGADTVLLTPAIVGFNFESPVTDNIPISVTNKSGGNATITVTLTVIGKEAS